MHKTDILTASQARQKILSGVTKLADVVTITLGAKGRNVAIAHKDYKGDIYKRDVIHDGVKVSKAINLSDEFENMGAAILREAAEKTVMEVGDGTTVTICLAEAIYTQAYNAISTGSDPVAIRLGLEAAQEKLTDKLSTFAIPIKKEQAKHIAYISSQEEITGNLIAEAIAKVGADGVIRIEESKRNKTVVDYQTGMQFDKGFAHNYFITDPALQEATLEMPYILVTDIPITTLEPLEALLKAVHAKKASLVIISPSFSPDALAFLIQNKVRGVLPNLAITAPSFGENQSAILEDIAILTGATYISSQAGYALDTISLEKLGRCTYVTSSHDATLISGGKGTQEALQSRVAGITTALAQEADDFKQQKLKERLGKLTNGIAIIHVGGYTEIEMKERKERIDDAVHATIAALKEGIIPGGEVIYLELRKSLNNSVAERILYTAFAQPFNKLLTNAGFDAGVYRERLANARKSYKGIDIRDGKVKNMIEAGIIDPVSVIRSAIVNSISVAISLILTEAIIVPQGGDTDEKFKKC